MTTTKEPQEKDTLLKTDRLGRARLTRERREALLEEFERSGLSGAEFAALIGVKYSTFAGWRQRRDRQNKETASGASGSPLRLVEAVMESPPCNPSNTVLVIELPGGGRMELSGSDQVPLVAALLKSLERC